MPDLGSQPFWCHLAVLQKLDAKAKYECRLLDTNATLYQQLDENSRKGRHEQEAYMQLKDDEPSHIDDWGKQWKTWTNSMLTSATQFLTQPLAAQTWQW